MELKTESAGAGHSPRSERSAQGCELVTSPLTWPPHPVADPRLASLTTGPEVISFEALYEAQFAFAWRNLRRLGVAEWQLRDAVQDVFLVVHRRLGEFEGRGTARAWLYSIIVRVAAQHRRTQRRKQLDNTEDAHLVADTQSPGPERDAQQNEYLRLLLGLLDELDSGKREVFVLADLEEMTAPEIASALGINLNTVYSRLRAARRELREALQRHADEWRVP